ncbi:hypothetical protein EV188_103529 [Actinomycetospora succinea]|uniref:Anti-sigma-M factor RsmA n=1 Tax=Actinomycetospora succinea TaxID=663603 RepID=A0A4R6VDY8_9PSEU|nr:hypothetical protein [Actinomycetospora succinea]TDQ61023.1 hypothetical protein EV188_103529 [Actinomycetospora succinea]
MTDDDRADHRPDRPDIPDPGDPEVAAALARTRADLAAHAARTPAMPAGLLGDIDRALAAERAEPVDDAVHDPVDDPVRPRRFRRLLVGAAALAVAAAAAVAVVVASVATPAVPAPTPTAAPAPPPDTPVLGSGDGVSALRAGLGRADYGPLTDPGRLAGCLAAHGVPPGTRPAGARQVVVDGRAGVLLVLPTGTAARFRLLVVEPGCAPGAPLTVSDTLVGR